MRKGAFFIFLAAMSWGTLPIWTKFLYQNGATALEAAAMRAYLAAVIYLIVFGAIKRSLSSVTLKDLPFYLVFGAITITGIFVFFSLALKELSSAMSVILLYTAPAFVTVLSRFIYKEKIFGRKLAGLLLTVAGCFLVVKGYDLSQMRGSLLGIFYGLMSGLCYSMLTIIGKKGVLRHSPQVNSTMNTTCGALVFFLVCPPWTVSVGSPEIFVFFLGLAVFGTVFPSLFYFIGLDSGLDRGQASILASLEPVFAAIYSYFLLQEALVAPQILGLAMTLLGAILPATKSNRPVESSA
ncbi:DMT family transporter [Deltaproteobacteria bacterium OttesenSCG-928-M10]|nr:DMT family transporter [Deltaproteobacteria bacterium OttesenSCG-928-M10]